MMFIFSGAMHKRLGRDVLTERENAKAICKQLKLSYYDPAEDENIKPHLVIDVKPSVRTMKRYVAKDDRAVDQSRMLLVLTGDTSSSGTLWEAGRAYYKNHTPIVIVAPRMYDGLLTNFTTLKATKICATQKSALLWIKHYLRRK